MTRKHMWTLLRVLVTVGLFSYVFGVLIETQDRVVLRDGTTLRGRFLNETSEGFEFRLAGTSEVREISRKDVAPGSSGLGLDVHPGFVTIVRRCQVKYLVAALFLWALCPLVAVIRWQTLNRSVGIVIPHMKAFRWNFIALFYNNVLPGMTGGDVIKAVYVARATERRTGAVVTVFLDRVIGLFALATLAAATLPFHLDNPDYRRAFYLVYGLLLAFAVGAGTLFSRRIRRRLKLGALIARLPFEGLIRTADEVMMRFRDQKKAIALAWGLSIINHVTAVSVNAICCRSLGIEGVTFGTLLVMLPTIWMISAIPISVGGWGLSEALYASSFERIGGAVGGAGAMGTRAVALSIIVRMITIAWSLIGGIYLLVGEKASPAAEVEAMDDGGGDPISEVGKDGDG
ncbi:MAG: lysylphosphatidylglycerol synthase transmembrane domain-containing protein [Planctomycetota bacterium]|nr:lysylphosphatidylglycerol synthase transmembrane domain-containing protein [Planctomycetota bacterium]